MTDPLAVAVSPPADDHLRTPVPEAARVPGWQVAIVCLGISVTLPALYTGGELARALGLGSATAAVLTGAALVGLMSVPAAVVGARTGLSTYMIIEHVFGWAGAKLVNLAFGVVLLGWYSVTAELFGQTLALAAAEFGLVEWPRWAWILASSALVTATTLYGFRALDRLALVAVPPLTLFLCWTVIQGLETRSLPDLLAVEGTGMAFTEGVSVVIGALIVGVVLMPDLARYARSDRDALVAAILGNGGGIAVSTLLAMIPALAFGVLDPMAYFALLGFGLSALVVLVFATWTTNGVNLWSTSLVVGSALPRARYSTIVACASVLGTAAAIVGIADRLTDFLIILGLVVPPVAGVYLTRFFLLGQRDFSPAHFEARPAVDVVAVVATVLAASLALAAWLSGVSLTGFSSLESLLLAALLTVVGDRMVRQGSPTGVRPGEPPGEDRHAAPGEKPA